MSERVASVFFAPYRLDLDEGRLWRGARETSVRPKTFAVLWYLATNAGRLVTTGELVHVVWADGSGAAGLVKGCVREIRRLLGDDAGAPRYVETVGRRGYRFVAPVAPAADAVLEPSGAGEMHFVGRLRELDAGFRGEDDRLPRTSGRLTGVGLRYNYLDAFWFEVRALIG